MKNMMNKNERKPLFVFVTSNFRNTDGLHSIGESFYQRCLYIREVNSSLLIAYLLD